MIAYEVRASRAFFAAILADGFAYFIASAAFVLAYAAFEAEFAVITQSAIFHALTAFAAMVLVVAITVGTFAAVIAIVAFPVVVAPAAAEFALHAVFISGIHRHSEE